MIEPKPWSAPQLATPVVSLSTESRSAAGASNATAENQAGARNSTFTTLHKPANDAIPASPYSIWGPMEEEEELQSALPHLMNLGPAHFESAYSSSSCRSLGEIARLQRQENTTRNVRVYTNEDIDRVKATTGLGLVPNSSPPHSPQDPQHDAQPQQNPRDEPQQQNLRLEPNDAVPSHASPVLMQVAEDVLVAPQATTDSAPQQDSTGGEKLPSGASNLPLLAVLGLVAGVAGILCRK